jgi:hypothetical protein
MQDPHMRNKRKRIVAGLILVILILSGTGLAIRISPYRLFTKKYSIPDSAFIDRQNLLQGANTFLYDFEVGSENAGNKGLYKGIAHSGNYSATAFGIKSSTFVVEKNAAEFGLDNLNAIGISAWVYVFPGDKDIDGTLIFSASGNGKNLYWNGVILHGDDIPRGQWFKISGFFNLSGTAFPNDSKLRFYFLNKSDNKILIDDLFISVGGPKPRRGDSVLADLTDNQSFTPRYNYPPFPVLFFQKEDITFPNPGPLIKDEKNDPGEIQDADKVITGHFFSPVTSIEDILVITKNGNARLFVFNKEKRAFQPLTVVFPAEINPKGNATEILKGAFYGKKKDQLVWIVNGQPWLCEPGKENHSYGKNITGFSYRWNASKISFPGISGFKGVSFLSSDLNGDSFSELLAVSSDGSWKIFSLAPDPRNPRVLAEGKAGTVPEWSAASPDRKIFSGKFLANRKQDVLLTVFRHNGNNMFSYALTRFDQGRFIPCFHNNKDFLGKTFGIDTLKPSDHFFTGVFDDSGLTKTFRYNRDWRYDLKEISFNDSSFSTLANIDFKGYSEDHNPKYYEMLDIFPGGFITPDRSSLLLIQKNREHRGNALPDAAGVYSFNTSN